MTEKIFFDNLNTIIMDTDFIKNEYEPENTNYCYTVNINNCVYIYFTTYKYDKDLNCVEFMYNNENIATVFVKDVITIN